MLELPDMQRRNERRPANPRAWIAAAAWGATLACVTITTTRSARAANTAGESWGTAWVNVSFHPDRPRAGESMRIDIDVLRGTPAESVDVGIISPVLEREAAFSRVVRLSAPSALPADPLHPGHYALTFVPPHSGLYRVRLLSASVGTAQPAQIEFPVWPRGRNPYIAVPIAMLALLVTGSGWWLRRQRATA